jgi:hypothetical protein
VQRSGKRMKEGAHDAGTISEGGSIDMKNLARMDEAR